MVWFKLDDRWHSHRKVIPLSLEARGLWATLGSWCAEQLNGGHVPHDVCKHFGGKRGVKLALELVNAGLWVECEGGHKFHDWAVHQPSKEAVLARKQATLERVHRHRNGVTKALRDERNGVRNGVSNAAPGPDPVPVQKERERARVESGPTSQHQLRIGFTQRLETEASTHPNQKALGQAIQQLVPWVEKTAPLRKLSEAELITRLLNGFFANENARTKGFPPAFLAQNPTEYLDTKPQLRAAARVPDGIPPIKHYGPREETG